MPEPQDAPTRLRSLDGVRGVAAVVVVVDHSYLIAQPHLPRDAGSFSWWVENTPLHLLISGNEAVLIFFLLSGLVVALPALRPSFDWAAYYPRRIVRLYLPVLASLVLAVLLILSVPRADLSAGTWAGDSNAQSVTLPQLFTEGALLETRPTINNPLWSLTWEVAFSLLLPLFVWVAVKGRRFWVALIVVCVIARVAGNVLDVGALIYLPVFLIGTLAAVNLVKIGSATAAVEKSAHPRWMWGGAIVLSVLLLTLAPTLNGLGIGGALDGVAKQAGILGAVLVVFLAIAAPGPARLLETPVIQWLGKVSFSLYLVHVPILVTFLALVGEDNWWLALVLGVPVSVVVAWGFEIIVERPSHRLARSIGQWTKSRRSSKQAVPSDGPATRR